MIDRLVFALNVSGLVLSALNNWQWLAWANSFGAAYFLAKTIQESK